MQATDAIVGQLGFSAAKSTDGQAEQGGGDEIDALFDAGGDVAAGGDEGDEGHVVRPAKRKKQKKHKKEGKEKKKGKKKKKKAKGDGTG